MLSIKYTTQFKKDCKTAMKRGKDLKKMFFVIDLLSKGKKLSAKFNDHKLLGVAGDIKECHIAPDWILIYRIHNSYLELIRTGTHSDLF